MGATWWILMSRRFRICMAKGGRESLRSRYGRSKLTLISRLKKKPKTVFPKTFRPQFSRLSLAIVSAVFWYIWNIADSMASLKSENCGRKVLGDTSPIFAGNSRFNGISQLRPGKTRSKRPRSHCLSTVQKFPFFTKFHCRTRFFCRLAADSILMPPTFPIARLNCYAPNFLGLPQKLTWCQQFGLQIFPKWGDAEKPPQKNAVFRCFFGRNKFSRPNGRLSPIACHTYLESYGT